MARESTIQIYNSASGTTCPDDLSQGELAFAAGSGLGSANGNLFIGLNGGATAWIAAGILDEDDFVSDSPNHLATHQSIKAYVDSQTVAAGASGIQQFEGITGYVNVTTLHGVTHFVDTSSREFKVQGITASDTEVGVAKFDSTDFSVTDGEVALFNRFFYVSGDGGLVGSTAGLGLTVGFFGDTDLGPNTVIGKGGGNGDVSINFSNPQANTSGQKGVATFENADFDVSSGSVSLEGSVLKSVQTNSGVATPDVHILGVSGGTAIETSGSGSTVSVAVKQASTSQLGVASFSSSQFSVGTTGHVTLLGGADGAVLSVTGDADTGTKASRSGSDVTISGITASASQMGVAKFDSGDFDVSASTGVVTLKNSGTDGAVLGIEGTANEVEATRSGATFTVGLPNDVVITSGLTVGGDAIISGNLTVNGTTTTVNTATMTVQDPIIYIAEGNSSTAIDVGIIGNQSSTAFAGLVRSDSVDGTFRWYLFEGLTKGSPGASTALDSDVGNKAATIVAKINAGTF